MTDEAFGSRLVFLALKCAWDLDDETLERVAASAGVGAAWLSSAAAQARRSLEPSRARFEALASRRNASWCRTRLLEARLASELDPARRSLLAESLARERRRFDRVRQEIVCFRPVVSNAIVARILGVPKGTVDSGLYYLKKKGLQEAIPRAGTVGAATRRAFSSRLLIAPPSG